MDPFGGGADVMEVDIEITIGDQTMGRQHLAAPYQMVAMQCQEVVNQVAQDERPMKVVIYGNKTIDLPNGNTTEKPARLIYANNKYVDNFELDYA